MFANRTDATTSAAYAYAESARFSPGVEIIKLKVGAASRMEAATLNYTRRALGDLERRGLPANMLYLELVSANAALRTGWR